MTAPIWPTALPQYLLTRNYAEDDPNTVVRTTMDAGPAKVRRRFTAGVRQVSGIIVVDEDQLDTLSDFFMNDCAGGAIAFQWTMQRRQRDTSEPADTSQIADTSLLPLIFVGTNTYRFVKAPKYTDCGDGQHYEVALALEILP
jgi:hypothetical protein